MGNITSKTICFVATVVAAKFALKHQNDATCYFDEKFDKITDKLDEIHDKTEKLFEIRLLLDNAASLLAQPGKEGSQVHSMTTKDEVRDTDALVRIESALERIDEMIGRFPSDVEDVTKKYSVYMHDEHAQILNAVRRPKLWNNENSKAMSLPPSPRVSFEPTDENKKVLNFAILNKKAAVR